jgi:NADPH:quinone reductase-like Zn-dependent oxidoreductase
MSMRAMVQHRFGAPVDVLRIEEVDRPVISADEVLVRVHASSANPWDWHFIRAEPYFIRLGPSGFRWPRHPVPGGDVAGVVEEVGSDVAAFKPGDEVYGFGHGAFAEFLAVPQGQLAIKPANITFEEAASVPLAGATALQGLREVGDIQAGQHVLIIGASGGIGTFAVQMAKHYGAEVTGVCSAANVELVRSLGADHVIDYRSEDYTRGEARYDLVFQLGGTASPGAIRRVMTEVGTLVQCAGDGNGLFGPMVNVLKAMATNRFVSQRLALVSTKENTATFDEIRDLIESGVVRPVIHSTVPLEEAGAAVALVEDGSPGGKVVVRVA